MFQPVIDSESNRKIIMTTKIKRVFFGGLYGLCIGLFLVAFYKYFWDSIKPFFITNSTQASNKILLLGVTAQ
jgi:hypothetical protein